MSSQLLHRNSIQEGEKFIYELNVLFYYFQLDFQNLPIDIRYISYRSGSLYVLDILSNTHLELHLQS